ncbi:MAG: adenine-specific methylase [Mucilaginibacter sp.]|nr:adenine-specific methylase [Mucilaginibacter sp.]
MLIEKDEFPFEFVSQLAEKESWRKEVYRPIYHMHKWWAKRLGSVFRGVLLGCVLNEDSDFEKEFYDIHHFSNLSVFDPFMGSGTTVGEAHKLGLTSFGRDINPIAAESVRVALGPLDESELKQAYQILSDTVRPIIARYYQTTDLEGNIATVLYYFWVMTATCEKCNQPIDLFSNYIVSQDAYPKKKPTISIVCPSCSEIFQGHYLNDDVNCPNCNHHFQPRKGPVTGGKVCCTHCNQTQAISSLFKHNNEAPIFRLYGKLILTHDGKKQYLKTTLKDLEQYKDASLELSQRVDSGDVFTPNLSLEEGYNTKQALNYNFTNWRNFFNDRQLLILGILHESILGIENQAARDALLTLFSSTLEFSNMFASYKGEGTGAVRHMFAHHILKPERIPLETNIWGTSKSSGSFSGLFKTKLLRAVEYRKKPTEVRLDNNKDVANSLPIIGNLHEWPAATPYVPGAVYLSCGDSAKTGLHEGSIDFVVTDPPFFDNVHYSELADFFYSWQVLHPRGFVKSGVTTRQAGEVQDGDVGKFSSKLKDVFAESCRVLKDDGLLVFSYHHSREQGWDAVADALDQAGLYVVNAHPVKAEMSGAKPKVQAKSPIQLDIMVICRKKIYNVNRQTISINSAKAIAEEKVHRLKKAGFVLSSNDEMVIYYGQYLTTNYFSKVFVEEVV